jgi:signal transduction protein with GAF and PtsI domain
MHKNDVKEIKLETLEELMQLTVAARSFEDLTQRIVEKCAGLLRAELCTLWRRIREGGQDKLVLGGSEGFRRKPREEIPIYKLNWDATDDKDIEGVTAWIAIRRVPYRVNSFIELDEHPSHRGRWDRIQWDAQADSRFKSLIGIPLLVEDNVVGVLKWENSLNPEGFSENDFNLAKNLAPFIAIALEAMNVREEHEKHRQEILKGLTVALLSPFEPRKLYKQIVDTTADLLYADLCTMWLCDSDRRVLRLAAAHGVRLREEDIPVYQLNWDVKNDQDIQGITAWIALRGKSFFARYFEDLKKHPSHRGVWDLVQWDGQPDKHFGSLYAVPLVVNNLVHGALGVAGTPKSETLSNFYFKPLAEGGSNFLQG